MEETAFAAIEHYGLISQGDTVIAALSGGADSVALFHFLHTRAAPLGITLLAAHFEHGIRGKESQKDACFVKKLCEKYGVELFLEHGNMALETPPKGLGIEAWARRLRYAFFERLADSRGAKVATAHTLSDNAETVLFNAIRGSGPRGLAGIPPRRGCVIRPLIWVGRPQVEAYCARNALPWVRDATNTDLAYSRNRIRLKALPELEQAHPGAQMALARLAGDMLELDVWLAGQAGALLAAAGAGQGGVSGEGAAFYRAMLCGETNGGAYDAAVLRAAPRPVLLKALAMLVGPAADRAALHRALKVLWGECAYAQLPGGVCARFFKGWFYVGETARGAATGGVPEEKYALPLREGTYSLPGGFNLEVSVAVAGGKKNTQKGLTFVADYDTIDKYGHAVFRPRQPGDTFAPPRRGVTKPLKKWMNETGVPPQMRGRLPVLAVGTRVLWVWGAGFCDALVPGEDTRHFLKIDMRP